MDNAVLSLNDPGHLALSDPMRGADDAVISKEAAMLASLVRRVTSVFRRKRCPECGHKARKQTFCDVCGYELFERTRDSTFRGR